MVYMYKLYIICIIVIIVILIIVSCTQDLNITYNEIDRLINAKAPYIEGEYSQKIEADDFKKLTGINILDSLPEDFKNENIVYFASYDKNNKILNISVGIGEENNGWPISIAVDSKEEWSELSYSPIDYFYDDEGINDMVKSDIYGVSVNFIHYNDNKSDYKLGYDVNIAEFDISDTHIYVESNKLDQADFKNFVTKLINSTK